MRLEKGGESIAPSIFEELPLPSTPRGQEFPDQIKLIAKNDIWNDSFRILSKYISLFVLEF